MAPRSWPLALCIDRPDFSRVENQPRRRSLGRTCLISKAPNFAGGGEPCAGFRAAVRRFTGAELWAFMRVQKKFWLLPVIVMMAVFGGLVVLGKGSVIAPFYLHTVLRKNRGRPLLHATEAR